MLAIFTPPGHAGGMSDLPRFPDLGLVTSGKLRSMLHGPQARTCATGRAEVRV